MNIPQINPERPTQVTEWMDELHAKAQQSYETCHQLRDRLAPVLRREADEACAPPFDPETELVDVAAIIREAVKVINNTTETHREMLRLLEV